MGGVQIQLVSRSLRSLGQLRLHAGTPERLTLIHSYSEIAVTEHGIDDMWRNRILMVFRP